MSPLLRPVLLVKQAKRGQPSSPFPSGRNRHQVSLDEGGRICPRASTEDLGISSAQEVASPADGEGRPAVPALGTLEQHLTPALRSSLDVSVPMGSPG